MILKYSLAFLLLVLINSMAIGTRSQTSAPKTQQIGEFQMSVKKGTFKMKRDVKIRTIDLDGTGDPILLSSPRIELQGKSLIAHGTIPASGEGFIKSATITNNVRIVLRQEGDKHVITCNKAVLESGSAKGKKTIDLSGNIRDESTGIFGDAVMTAETGRIEWEGPIMEVKLDDATVVANPAPKNTLKKPKAPATNPSKKDKQ
jgi:hypothetical protein